MQQTINFVGAGLIAVGLFYLLVNAPQTGAALLLTSVAAFVVKEMALGQKRACAANAVKMTKTLIIHGLDGSPAPHWQHCGRPAIQPW